MTRSHVLAVLLVAGLAAGCSSTGGVSLGQSRAACTTMTTLLGAVGGVVVANQGEGETDEKLVGGSLGALGGAALGTLLCGEGGVVEAAAWDVQIRATPSTGDAPLSVVLQAELSPASVGIRSYDWDLGDGTQASGARIAHTYREASDFDVRLIATNAGGERRQSRARIVASAVTPAVGANAGPAPEIALPEIHFAFDSSEIPPADRRLLEQAAEGLRALPARRIRIVGHADRSGSERYNQRLSERRAAAVLEFLSREGVSPERMHSEGLGESRPVQSTPERPELDRRVELELRD